MKGDFPCDASEFFSTKRCDHTRAMYTEESIASTHFAARGFEADERREWYRNGQNSSHELKLRICLALYKKGDIQRVFGTELETYLTRVLTMTVH